MTAKKRLSYGEAVEQSRQILADARLADPDEHFPYKLDDAVRGGLPERIANASQDMVAAQEALLRDPSDENRVTFKDAQERLVAARNDYRSAVATVTTVAAPRDQKGGE